MSSLLDYIMKSIFQYAAQQNVKDDPEFQEQIKKHKENIKQLSQEIEAILHSTKSKEK